jgi:hypothetical protein
MAKADPEPELPTPPFKHASLKGTELRRDSSHGYSWPAGERHFVDNRAATQPDRGTEAPAEELIAFFHDDIVTGGTPEQSAADADPRPEPGTEEAE